MRADDQSMAQYTVDFPSELTEDTAAIRLPLLGTGDGLHEDEPDVELVEHLSGPVSQ